MGGTAFSWPLWPGFRSRKDQTLRWGGGCPAGRRTVFREERSPQLWKSPPAPVPTFCKRLQTPDVPRESPFGRQPISPGSVPISLRCANDCPHLAAGQKHLRSHEQPPRPVSLRAGGWTDRQRKPAGLGARGRLGGGGGRLPALLCFQIPRNSHLQQSAATQALAQQTRAAQPPRPAPMTSAASRDLTPATGCAMSKSRN